MNSGAEPNGYLQQDRWLNNWVALFRPCPGARETRPRDKETGLLVHCLLFRVHRLKNVPGRDQRDRLAVIPGGQFDEPMLTLKQQNEFSGSGFMTSRH